ncbi:MAG: hypothetical protein SFX73_30860 [Kofleriaceae bacterium]|nr:hypothetical protein [Kofleriaceae bacterium]
MGGDDRAQQEARRAAGYFSCAMVVATSLAILLLVWRELPWSWMLYASALATACLVLVLAATRLARWASLSIIALETLLALVGTWAATAAQAASGHPFAPFTGQKLLALLIGLLCPSFPLGAALIAIVTLAPIVQASLWTAEIRAAMPIYEPWQTLAICVTSAVLLGIRQRHIARGEALAQLCAERAWFERISQLGGIVRERMQRPLDDLHTGAAAITRRLPEDERSRGRMDRALARLQQLSDVLGQFEMDRSGRSSSATSAQVPRTDAIEARRATLGIGVIAALGGLASLIAMQATGLPMGPGLVIVGGGALGITAAFALPQLSRSAYIVVFAVASTLAVLGVLWNNDNMAAGGHFEAFPGIKVGVLVVALLAPSGRIGALLIALMIFGPIAETYLWWSAEQRARMPLLEPWLTGMLGLAAFGLLVAQRRRSARMHDLARVRAERDGLARVASLVLSLWDLARTPLQTLMMSRELIHDEECESELGVMDAGIAELRELLSTLPEPAPIPVDHSFDALERIARATRETREVLNPRSPRRP